MKLRTIFLSILLLGANCPHSFAQSVQKKYLRHIETIKDHTFSFSNQGIPLKANRLSNNEGNIILTYDKNLSDSVQISLLAATKLWKSKITTTQPIFISVLFESLGNDISMIADVAYCETPNLVGCPCALASQISGFPYGSENSPDGYIILNSDINWNCRFSKDTTSACGYNLTTMALRGIARCLGFGSSVFEESKDNFSFYFGWPTYFDKLLYYNQETLSNVMAGSSKMANFVKSNQVFAKAKTQNYKIYAPDKFVQNLSLCYFDLNNSIMSYAIGQGKVNLSIDEKTTDVLRTIGWDLPLPGLNIKCNNISNNGIGSSYEPHTFFLLKGNENISNYSWRFLLKNKQGEFTQISNGTSEVFIIDKISSPDTFFVNINGDLEGRIECNYSINGQQYSAIPFTLSLELKPTILSINEISTINKGQFEFSSDFNVYYAGADYVSIEIEEEYNTTLRNYRFDEPYIAHIKTGNITNLYYSWITISVSNKYGNTHETIEFAPTFGAQKTINNSTQALSSHRSSPFFVKEILLYTIEGMLIFKGNPSEFTNYVLKPGLYIKQEIFNNGLYKTSKISI